MLLTQPDQAQPVVSIIIPARNEEFCLAACLQSLVAQTGIAFEIIVVDDHSTDRTHEIASSFSDRAVRVIEAPELPAEWTGKNNALAAGVKTARGSWLLFTDADTIHFPGSVARALDEAKQHKVDLLSYSPKQIAVTFWEMATMPVIFAELASAYSPRLVSDPDSSVAAANGQYILIAREAYAAVGGHAAIADQILEDVALARAVKRSGRKLFFRYAPDAACTRMYRGFARLRDGWTKNLALLFPKAGRLAAKIFFLWTLPYALLFIALVTRNWWLFGLGLLGFACNAAIVRGANFDRAMQWLAALFGMPVFAYLLLRSRRAHRNGEINWKGRTYLDLPTSSSPSEDRFPNGPPGQRNDEESALLRTGH